MRSSVNPWLVCTTLAMTLAGCAAPDEAGPPGDEGDESSGGDSGEMPAEDGEAGDDAPTDAEDGDSSDTDVDADTTGDEGEDEEGTDEEGTDDGETSTETGALPPFGDGDSSDLP